ncbi:MAG: sugar ABC transporter permease [Spirochaetales bacterium]|nr:sugar ABC transporter permease [Spirochaetales bacterium]
MSLNEKRTIRRAAAKQLSQHTVCRQIARSFRQQYVLYLMLLPVVTGFVIFHYFPLYGIIIAFKDYDLIDSYLGSKWVGLKHFASFFRDPYLYRIIKNTLLLGIYGLVWGFAPPIILAIMFHEMPGRLARRLTQTVSYLPHFIAVVIVVGMLKSLLLSTGIVNQVLVGLGFEAVNFFGEPGWFRTIFITSGIWQGAGWGSIVYLASLTGVNLELYDAAHIDGANRIQRIRHISIPGIFPVITILLILKVGKIVGTNFEKVYLMYNPLIYETADVIATYVYRRGIIYRDFGYATAVGLLNSIVAFVFIYGANALSRRISSNSLW